MRSLMALAGLHIIFNADWLKIRQEQTAGIAKALNDWCRIQYKNELTMQRLAGLRYSSLEHKP